MQDLYSANFSVINALVHASILTHLIKNAQVTTNLHAEAKICYSNNLSTRCARTACSQLVTWQVYRQRLVGNLLYKAVKLDRLILTTCYRPLIQQFVDKL